MSVSYWLDQSKTRQMTDCDFIVIGAGLAGLSIAYWLENKVPDARVIILERHTMGFGASGRNAGFITCGSIEHFARLIERHGKERAVEIWKFSERNHLLLKENIIQDQAPWVDYSAKGIASLALDRGLLNRFETTAHIMERSGLAVHPISSAQIKRDYSFSNYAGGVHFEHDGQVDPYKLLLRLRSKIRAPILESHEVFQISEDGLVVTQSGTFRTHHAFFAINGYLPLIAPEFVPFLVPQRNQAILTERLSQKLKTPVYLTHALAYARQLPTGQILVGGFRQLAPTAEQTYVDATTPEIQNALESFIRANFGSIPITHRWSGVMGFTLDGQMLVGRHPTRKNVSLMAGCSSHGMGLSFHIAHVLVEDYLGTSRIPDHLNVGRFLNA